MNILEKMWVDPVWSKVIGAGIFTIIVCILSKCKINFKKLNKKKLFTIKDINIIQKDNLPPCITVNFKSKEAIGEFERNGGKLVGGSGTEWLVREDCPILQKYMKSWKFKLKRLFLKKWFLFPPSSPQNITNVVKNSRIASSTDAELDKTEERILKYLNVNNSDRD